MRNKTIKMTVWLSPEESQELSEKAAKAGMKKGAYIRTLIREGTVIERMITDVSSIVREMNAIGNNINQFVALAHKYGVTAASTARLTALTEELWDLLKRYL